MRKLHRTAVFFLLLLLLPSMALASLDITATFYPLYITTLNIIEGAQGVTLSCLAPPQSGCLHDYQMTTADRRALADCDVLIYNGAGLEAFLTDILPTLSALPVCASEGLQLLPSRGHDHAHEHEHESEEDCFNPHVWVSPLGAAAQAQVIANALSKADPGNALIYAENVKNYIARLEAIHQKMYAALSPYAGESIVTFHEAFDYLAEALGLSVAAVVQTDSGSAPSPRELAQVVDVIGEKNVRALFTEEQYDDSSAQTIAQETGLPVFILDPVVSGPDDPNAYLTLMEKNLSTLLEAFK